MRLTTYTNYSLRIEETIGAISDMAKAGYVKYIGMTLVDVFFLKNGNTFHCKSMKGVYSFQQKLFVLDGHITCHIISMRHCPLSILSITRISTQPFKGTGF